MQHGDLDKTKVLKTQERFQEWWKETKISKCAKISPTGQTGFAYQSDWLDLFQSKFGPPDLFGPFTGFQRGFLDMSNPWLDMFGEHFVYWNLNSTGLVRSFTTRVQVLNLICKFRGLPLVSVLIKPGVFIPVWLVWWTSLTDLLW
jgi:hypothetical protein